MKQSIEAHKDCLKNRRRALAHDEQLLASIIKSRQGQIDQLKSSIALLDLQIDEAERRGLAAFDRERFLTKRFLTKLKPTEYIK